MSDTEDTERKRNTILYVDVGGEPAPFDDIDEIRKLRAAGHEVRPGTSGKCDTCGFLKMTDMSGVVVYNLCVCQVRKDHASDCRFRKAAEMYISITCHHGDDICPKCDPCTCGGTTP